jgi:hypothetical protein
MTVRPDDRERRDGEAYAWECAAAHRERERRLERLLDAKDHELADLRAEADLLRSRFLVEQSRVSTALAELDLVVGQRDEAHRRVADLNALLSEDAAGRPLPELLRIAADACWKLGGGPVEDSLRLKADEIEAALSDGGAL